MNSLVKQLLLGGSATALIASAGITGAFAQDVPSNDITTVEVSGSRINLAGFQSPTPVTVIGLEQIQRNAQLNIGDEIRDLPQVQGTATQSANTADVSQGDAGLDTLSLRNLGANRNLVLFDHQRTAISGFQGDDVDLSTIPTSLIQRVDVVTGGASAAWGSDAVTGVINIVINKNFEGFKANAEYQNNLLIPVPRYHYEAAWGTDFMNGLGHFEAGYDANQSNTPTFNGENPHSTGRTDVYNPAYCSQVTYAPGATTGGTCTSLTGAPMEQYVFNAGTNNYTAGGLINSTTAGTTGSSLGTSTTALKGVMFVGPNSAPTQFNYGSTFNNTTCYNGCTNDQYTSGNTAFGLTSVPYHDATLFTYTSFQVTPDIKASIQLGQGTYANRDTGTLLNSSAVPIYADNAYLPASIQQRFTCNGTATAACVTTLSNGYNPFTQTGGNANDPSQKLTVGFDYDSNRLAPASATNSATGAQSQQGDPGIWTMANACSAVGEACAYYRRVYSRASFALDGTLSDDWTWSSYFAYSGVRQREKVPNDPDKNRITDALDAVLVTSSNVGTSGLPIGSIQCRGLLTPSNLTTPSIAQDLAGCQPLDMFGYGNVSQAAENYISPGLVPGNEAANGFLNQTEIETNQVAAGMSVNGVLPWKLPAGEVAIAFGAEYSLNQGGYFNSDPIGARNVLQAGNFINYDGEYNVEEGFLEVNAPILKDYVVQTLDVDLAGRFTDYSTSGAVQTWKIGLNSQINDDFRVRAFISSDIRAPSVYELFAAGAANSQQCASWVTGGATNPCSAITGGNPCLTPEQANTTSAGLVMTPHWIDGLTASLDWYDLRMHGAITTVAFNTVIQYAQLGETAYCSSIITSTGANICNYSTAAGTAAPTIVDVRTGSLNAARQTTAGFDANIDYRFDLGPGTASIGVDANYVYDWSRTLNGVSYQGAGATGGYFAGGPNFRTTWNLVYHVAAWTFGAEIHGTGDAVRDAGTEGQAGITATTVSYTRINGVDVASITSGENGQGIYPTNYSPWSGNIGARVQYKWSDTVQLYGAMDNVFPGNKTYRVGVRFNL